MNQTNKANKSNQKWFALSEQEDITDKESTTANIAISVSDFDKQS